MNFKLLFLDKTAAENQFFSYFFSIGDFTVNPNFFHKMVINVSLCVLINILFRFY